MKYEWPTFSTLWLLFKDLQIKTPFVAWGCLSKIYVEVKIYSVEKNYQFHTFQLWLIFQKRPSKQAWNCLVFTYRDLFTSKINNYCLLTFKKYFLLISHEDKWCSHDCIVIHTFHSTTTFKRARCCCLLLWLYSLPLYKNSSKMLTQGKKRLLFIRTLFSASYVWNSNIYGTKKCMLFTS